MGWDTPAKIMSAAYLGLGRPEPELLQRDELSDIVFQRLAFYYEGIRTSDQNAMSKWTSEFTLSASESTKNLTALTSSDIVMPLWAERKREAGTTPIWEFVPTVNLDSLTDKRLTGESAVTFYGETANSIFMQASYFGSEVGTPYSTFRVRYAPVNSFSANVDASITIPDNLTPLIVTDVKLQALPLMQVNMAKYALERPGYEARMASFAALQQQLMMNKEEWKPMYERFVRRSRGQRARHRNDILGSRFDGNTRKYWGV